MASKIRKQNSAALDRLASELEAIQYEGLTEHLVRQMKAWVLRGLVKPGERLPPERELAAMLNVSRSSLRQALKALQVIGLLEVRQGSGNYLTTSSESILRQPANLLVPLRGVSFAELFEARRGMEGEAAASAALRATKSDLQKLKRELDQMQSHLKNPEQYFKHDVAFHHFIAVASGNSVFVWLFELVSKVLQAAWLAKAREGNSSQTFLEHQNIAKAIELRDAESARTAMLRHLMLSKFYSNQQTPVELRVVSQKD